MKMFSLIALLVVTHTSSIAQTIVCGKISNPKDKTIKINSWNGASQTYESTLNKDGSFKIHIDARNPGRYDLEHGGETTEMFLYSQDSIYVTLDTKMFDETLVYSGKGAQVNNYLAKKLLHDEKSLGSEEFMQTYYRKIAFSDAQTFSTYADSIAKVKLDYLNMFKLDLPVAFYDYQYADIVYDCATDKADYPSMHYYVRGIQDSTVAVEPSFFQFYDQLSVDNENYLESYDFVAYLGYYLRYKTKLNFGRDSISTTDQLVSARFLFKGRIKEKAISELVSKTLDYGTPQELKDLYQLSAKDITDIELRNNIDTKYKLVSSLLPGNPAPAISLKSKDGKMVNLSDFKGKVVFLDFWASWCTPCMREMPYAKILQDTFATKDVVFLYVSVDEDEKAWRKTMEAKKMKGVHLRANGFDEGVVKRYGVNGIPTYFLIGKDGIIINNTPSRPSSPDVFGEIEDALKAN